MARAASVDGMTTKSDVVALLAEALYEAERPDKHWPTWREYLDAFGHPPTQEDVWIRKAERLLAALPEGWRLIRG